MNVSYDLLSELEQKCDELINTQNSIVINMEMFFNQIEFIRTTLESFEKRICLIEDRIT